MKRFNWVSLAFCCVQAFASMPEDAFSSNCRESANERAVRHVNLSFRFSADSFPEEPFDVCGLSAGVGLDAVSGHMNGLQLAGLAAWSDSISGVQLAGITSVCEYGSGLQVAVGGAFADHDFFGLQIGLLASTASGTGLQFSLGISETDDVFNLADNLRNRGRTSRWSGIQCAGLANRACHLDGMQVGIAFNYAVRCRGVQIGCWNRSDMLIGFQLGAFNRADELHGLQVGFFNQARKGSGVQMGLINSFGETGGRLVLPFVNARF